MYSKTMKKSLAIILTLFMILTLLPSMALFAATGEGEIPITKDFGVSSRGEESDIKEQLDPGEIYVEKNVFDNEDGTFTITLYAWGATYSEDDMKPLDPENTDVVVTDEIDKMFAYDDDASLTAGSFSVVGGTATWTISQDDILGEGPATVTFTVSLKEGWATDTWYRTNEGASALFQPAVGNPYYYKTSHWSETTNKTLDYSWNQGSENGLNSFTIKDPDLNATITLRNYNASTTVTITIEGQAPVTYTFNSAYSSGSGEYISPTDANDNQWGFYWLRDEGKIKTLQFWFKGLEGSGNVTRYDFAPGNNGGNVKGVQSEGVLHEYSKTEKILGRPWIDDGPVIKQDLPNKGKIRLVDFSPSINITKKVTNPGAKINNILPIANYTLTVANDGKQGLVDVKVADKLSSTARGIGDFAVTLGSAPLIESADYEITLTGTDGAYTGFVMTFLNFSEDHPFAPSGTITVSYSVRYQQIINGQAKDRENEATATAASALSGNPVSDSAEAKAEQPGTIKSASIEKKVYSINDEPVEGDGPFSVENDDEIIYAVTVTNTGELNLRLTGITDSRTDAIRCNADGSTDNLPEIAGPLQAGHSLTVYFKYLVNGWADGASIDNTAAATFKDYKKIEDDETVIVAAPIIKVEKTITNSPEQSYDGLPLFSHGDDVTFRITITNTGNADASATLSDILHSVNNEGYNPAIELKMLNDVNEEIPVPDPLTVPAKSTVTVFYSVKAEGQTDYDFDAAVEAAIQAVEAAYDEYQKALYDAQAAVNAEMAAVREAQEKVAQAEQDLNDALAAYNEASAPVFVYGEEGEILDIEESAADRTDLTEAEEALAQAEKALASAEVDLKAAQDAFEALIAAGDVEGGGIAEAEESLAKLIDGGSATSVYKYKNYAAYGDYDHDSKKFAVDYEKLPFIKLNKEVRVNDGEWVKFALAKEGDAVEFRIIVKNIGLESSRPMQLNDVFDGGEGVSFEIPAISAGGQYEISLGSGDYDWGDILSNPSVTEAKLATNTATLYLDDEEVGASSASVVIPPQPAPILSIDKQVRVNGTEDAFAKSAIVNSNESVEFEFRIIVTNSGNADAVVNIRDFFRGEKIDEIVTIPAGESRTFYMTAEIGVNESDLNTAEYDCENAINPSGSSSAYVKVIGVPYSILSVEKQVLDKYGDWVDDALFRVSAGETQDAIFRITVSNDGEAAGRFTLTDAFDGEGISLDALYLSPYFLEDERLIDSDFYSGEEGYLMVRAGDSLELFYKAEDLAPREDSYVNDVAIEIVRAEQPGQWAIFDTIKEADETREAYDRDSAQVTIKNKAQYTVTLDIDKKVALSGEAEDPTAIAEDEWKDAVSVVTNGAVNVYYRITVTKGGDPDYGVIVNLSDLLDGEDFGLGAEDASFVIGAGETLKEIYLKASLTGVGEHINVVKIVESAIVEGPDDETDVDLDLIKDHSEATVTISRPGTHGDDDADGDGDGDGDVPETPPPPVVDIPDIAGPLGDYIAPEPEDYVILDEETPLGNLPQTGSATHVGAGLMGLFGALGGLAAAGATLFKKEEDR